MNISGIQRPALSELGTEIGNLEHRLYSVSLCCAHAVPLSLCIRATRRTLAQVTLQMCLKLTRPARCKGTWRISGSLYPGTVSRGGRQLAGFNRASSHEYLDGVSHCGATIVAQHRAVTLCHCPGTAHKTLVEVGLIQWASWVEVLVCVWLYVSVYVLDCRGCKWRYICADWNLLVAVL